MKIFDWYEELQKDFEFYMRDTFEEEFDPNDINHIIKQNIFSAGWIAGVNKIKELK